MSKTNCEQIVLNARGNEVKYFVKEQAVESCGVRQELKPRSQRVSLRILVDRMSIETFGNEGEVSITNQARAQASKPALALDAIGGEAYISSVSVHTLRSIWPAHVATLHPSK
jgi:sucrose-6-phosphate hydrolase SacC (GH32 family)